MAQNRYVATTGSDNVNDCTISANPCATIQQAIDSSSVGDSVFVASGTYDSFGTSFGGSSGLYIKGDVGAKIVLAYSVTNERIVDLRADSTTFTGFTVKGGGAHTGVAISGRGIMVSDNIVDSVSTAIQTTTQYTEGNAAITGNTITNSGYGISLQNNTNTVTGNDIDVSTEGIGIGSALNVITNNDIKVSSGGIQVQTYSGGSLPGADIDLLAFLSSNDFNRSVIVKDDSGLKIETIFGDMQKAIDSTSNGDSVFVGEGEYAEELTVNISSIKLIGAQFGIDARNRSAPESNLIGGITLSSTADSIFIDGFTISEGANLAGENAAIYIHQKADHTTIQNTIFARSGTVDGDSYRGIVTAVGGNHTKLLIQRNSFSGWATGVFLNPGPSDAQILNNDFDTNYVGMSFDGPDSVTILDNSFHNNVFEGLGLGPWTGSEAAPDELTAIIAGNDFDTNTTHIGLYLGINDQINLSNNSFGGENISGMTLSELLAIEEKVGHGVDTSGGYSGFALLREDYVFITNSNSISKGLGFASSGDTVFVGKGTYDENVSISTNNVTITGQDDAELQVDKNETGFSVSSDSVGIKNMKITGPYSFNFNTVDWDALPNAFGIMVNGTASNILLDNNTISNVRTGISFVNGSAGSATNNTIDNTKGSFIIRTDDVQLSGNSIDSVGNEWDIVLLQGVTSDGYTASPLTSIEDYSADILSLSTSNGGMKILDRRYGSNGILNTTSTIGNRSHIYISAGSGFTASDDFDFGNGLGNLRQPLGNIEDGINGVVVGGNVNVLSGTYSEQSVSIKKNDISLSIASEVSGIDTLAFDTSVEKLSLTGNDSSLVIMGNDQANTFTISGSANTIDGGTGTDQIVLAGNRHEYTISDNSGFFTLTDGRTNSPNGDNVVSNVQEAGFDDITISLSFGNPVTYPGTSLYFPNNTTEIEILNDAVLQFADSLTIELWVKADGFDSADQTVLKKGDTSWSIHRNASTNFIAFTTYISGVPHTLEGTTSVNDTKWHHIVAVFTGSNKLLYVDGILDSQASVSGSLDTDTEPITIGGWAGNIDELRIWSTIRNAEHIRTNVFQQLKVDEPGLVGYWRMDDGSGSVVGDLTSNKNDINIAVSSSLVWSTEAYPTGSFITGDEGWRIITSPASGLTYAQILEGLWTQGFSGADIEGGTPNVYTYTEGDGDTDASGRGFTVISSASGVPSEGQAILVYVYEDDDPGTEGIQGGFPKIIKADSTQRFGTVTPSLSITKSGVGGTFNSSNDGWNLIGNPYASTIDWDESDGWTRTGLDNTMYVWSDSAGGGTGAYLSWNGITGTLGTGKVSPMQGFWVKADNSAPPSLAIDDTARSSGANFLKQNVIPELRFSLDGERLSSKSIIMFSEESSVGKDNFDAYKLASNNTDWLSISTSVLKEEGTMDIQALPVTSEQPIEMSLDIDGSDLGGEFTLSWHSRQMPEYLTIQLLDVEEEKVLDLSKEGSYKFTFNSKAKNEVKEDIVFLPDAVVPQPILHKESVLSGRFTIVIKNIQTAIDEPENGIPSILELAQNYPNPFNPNTNIEFGIPNQSNVTLEVFNILGRKVATLISNELKQAGRHSVNFNAGSLASGIYIYRISTDDSAILKKMILLK